MKDGRTHLAHKAEHAVAVGRPVVHEPPPAFPRTGLTGTSSTRTSSQSTDLKLNHKSLILLTRLRSRKWLSFFVNDPPGAGAGLI